MRDPLYRETAHIVIDSERARAAHVLGAIERAAESGSCTPRASECG